MRQPLPTEARRDGRRTAILSTVAEMRDLAAETMREHGAAAAVTPVADATWDLRADGRPILTVCAPADAPAMRRSASGRRRGRMGCERGAV